MFTNYLNTAFSSGWWGLLGFLFLPTTTIAYAIAQNEFTNVRRRRGDRVVCLIVLARDRPRLLGGPGAGSPQRLSGRVSTRELIPKKPVRPRPLKRLTWK